MSCRPRNLADRVARRGDAPDGFVRKTYALSLDHFGVRENGFTAVKAKGRLRRLTTEISKIQVLSD
jgi:hypothetical protein